MTTESDASSRPVDLGFGEDRETSSTSAVDQDASTPRDLVDAGMDAASAPGQVQRAESFDQLRERLSLIERLNIAFIKKTFEVRAIDRVLEWLMRSLGAGWVHLGTRHLRIVRGLDRVGDIHQEKGFFVMSNHRSFFDMFVIQMLLYRHGFRRRVLFPVRSSFFYDHPLGFVVNGLMSFFSMYPPIFRDRSRPMLNQAAFGELLRALEGGRGAGLHPEGTRNKGDDPYQLLQARSGIGRAVHQTRLPVIPVFINGLSNSLLGQLLGNATRRGRKIIVVFGSPIDLGDLLSLPPDKRTYRLISERVMEAIATLGEEERGLRKEVELTPCRTSP